MASLPIDLLDYPRETPLRLTATVGVATWQVILDPRTIASLRSGYPFIEGDEPLACAAIDRVMTALRAKTVALHWYGGGEVVITAEDLGDTSIDDEIEDGAALLARWYHLVAIDPAVRPALHLVA